MRVASTLRDLLQNKTTAYSDVHGSVNQHFDDYYIVVYFRDNKFFEII